MSPTRHRGLRQRTFLVGFLTWVSLMALVVSITSYLLKEGFEQVEDREFLEMRVRVGELLRDHLEKVAWKSRDWGEWDAADAWLRTGAGDFAQENLNDSSLAILDEEFLGYFRADGTPASVMGIDPRTRRRIAADTACLAKAVAGVSEEASVGLRRCGEDLMVVAVSPVRNSLNTGASSGWFVIGHTLGWEQERKLGSLLGHPIRILDTVATGLADLDRGDSLAILRLRMEVAEGRPILVEVRLARPVQEVARRVRTLVMWALLSMSVVGTLLSLAILEFYVVRRVLRLSSDVLSHAEGGGMPTRSFGDGGPDEIGALGKAIDGLVFRLVGVQDRLSAALEAARESSRAKGAFLAAMSHDLRTPLNGMIGLNEFLLKTPLDDAQREAMELLRGASENLLAMINDILEHSRGEAGHTDLHIEEASTEEVFYRPIRVLAPIAHHQGLDLVLDLDPDLPRRLFLDASRIRQVLHNLVGNAVKFTDRGEVLVRVRLVERSPSVATLEVVVRDTGVGMSPESLRTIFEPFVQASERAGQRQGGTGLGLTISRQLVERMGGTLEVESVPGKGSEFRFRLALATGDDEAVLLQKRPADPGCGEVAILLRGNSSRELLGRIVERTGRTVRILEDLDSLQTQPPSFLVVDAENLGLGDLPLLPRLRAILPSEGIPVLVLSRTDRLQDETLCRPLGACEVLRLPAGPTALSEAIDRATHPRWTVALGNLGLFLSTMVAGVLRSRGHRVLDDLGSTEAASPEICILDGESPSFAADVADLRLRHPGAVLVRLGGTATSDDIPCLPRPFQAEALFRFVEAARLRSEAPGREGEKLGHPLREFPLRD